MIMNSISISNDELARYNRHIILPGVGIEGQKKLKSSSVLLVGAGGLGSPLALYLAAAGVGRLGIIDFDTVDVSNLQRQILHDTSSLGRNKAHSAKMRLTAFNPHIEVVTYDTKLTSSNGIDLFSTYDVIGDGSDNFETRYLVNDACVLTGKPNAYGSIFQFEGQVTVFCTKDGPCYRCLYPEQPPAGTIPSCAEGGVFGVLPGVIGSMQATEIIKLILGIGWPLIGRLMHYDALEQTWSTYQVQKNPDCPLCGSNPMIKTLTDTEAGCTVKAAVASMAPEITVEELKEKISKKESFILLDVREKHELEIAKLPGATHIPLGELHSSITGLAKDLSIFVLCRTGARSARAVEYLRAQGYDALNIAGGIHEWSKRIDSSMKIY